MNKSLRQEKLPRPRLRQRKRPANLPRNKLQMRTPNLRQGGGCAEVLQEMIAVAVRDLGVAVSVIVVLGIVTVLLAIVIIRGVAVNATPLLAATTDLDAAAINLRQ